MDMKMTIVTKIGIVFLILISSSISVDGNMLSIHSNPLATYTFSELGYNTTQQYLHSGNLPLSVNCTNSPLELYSAKIFLHITGVDTYYSFRFNGGAIQEAGSPGRSLFSGWQDHYVVPGFFLEGVNSFQIHIYEYDYDFMGPDPNKFLTIMHDSYIEIYDASALPLAIEWQGYEFNETDLTLNILIIEKLTGILVNTTNVTIQGSGENITGQFIGNGMYEISIPLPQTTVNLTLVIQGEGYGTLVQELEIEAILSGKLTPGDSNLPIYMVLLIFGTILGGIINYFGIEPYRPRKGKSRSFRRESESTSKGELLSPEYAVRKKVGLNECPICRKNVSKDENFAICPFCQNRFHLPHFEEALKVSGKCPICQQEIMHK
jgi:endogenous inhibitor of DNA gyrase (YacG/DUF329 family)